MFLYKVAALCPGLETPVEVGNILVAHAHERVSGERRAVARGAVEYRAPLRTELPPVVW